MRSLVVPHSYSLWLNQRIHSSLTRPDHPIMPVAPINLAQLSMCQSVMKSSRWYHCLRGIARTSTIANPQKIAPMTKNGGKMVACHNGTIDTAKSKDTIEWTLNTSGVEMPDRVRETF